MRKLSSARIGLAVVVVGLTAGTMIWRSNRSRDPSYTAIQNEPRPQLAAGQAVPDFVLGEISGGDFSLSMTNGKITLVNFWASWCEPCAREFPSLLKLVTKFGGKIELVAISIDTKKEDVLHFLRAFDGNGPHLHILWDPEGRVARQYGAELYPETFILAKDHKLLRRVNGQEDWMRPELQQFFSELARAQ